MTARMTLAIALLLVLACASLARAQDVPAVTHVVVDKSERRLELLAEGVAVRSYRVALGREPVGPKVEAGDNRTPEGLYTIDGRNARSRFHRALHISYPNAQDRRRAAELGVAPGGDIMVHGIQKGMGWIGPLHVLFDWTRGCIAVTNGEIEEIWELVADGTPIEIRP
jgi:murein L,D-transpeptidase YafK